MIDQVDALPGAEDADATQVTSRTGPGWGTHHVLPPNAGFVPTDEQRRSAEAMAGYGVPHNDIALVIGCSAPTLRKYFRHELDVGQAKANAKIAQTLFHMATVDRNVTAAIYWTKARMKWSERSIVELSGPDGGPIETVVSVIPVDLTGLSADELTKLYRVAVDKPGT